jgi:hypothetical protein
MSLPIIHHHVTIGDPATHAYGDDDPAIHVAYFRDDDRIYIVSSKRLAVDILTKDPTYSTAQIKLGLKEGWLILAINPTQFETLSNQLGAIRAVKTDTALDPGWYRLMIIPQYGKRYV